MNVMKKILLFILALMPILYSCDDDISPNDPRLNISEYTFGKEGGHLEVYSTIGYGIYFNLPYGTDTTAIETREEYGVPIIEGEWFKVSYMTGDYEKYGWNEIISIDVEPNDTGKERIVPIEVSTFDFWCQTSYKQAAE